MLLHIMDHFEMLQTLLLSLAIAEFIISTQPTVALKEIQLDIATRRDMLMVKPVLA